MSNDMQDNTNFELVKVGNPHQHDRFVRTEYYTKIKFKINGEPINIKLKVDTGSPYTVIGLDSMGIIEYKDLILPKKSGLEVFDASDQPLDIEQYNVTDFKLTNDIVFKEVELCFSEKLGEKSVLGMDILSLFEILYIFNDKHLNGSFYLRRRNRAMSIIDTHLKGKSDNIIRPITIFTLNDVQTEDSPAADLAAAFRYQYSNKALD